MKLMFAIALIFFVLGLVAGWFITSRAMMWWMIENGVGEYYLDKNHRKQFRIK